MAVTNILRDALAAKYRAEITGALANFSIYVERPVGTVVGAADQDHVAYLDTQLELIMRAQEKLAALERIMPVEKDDKNGNDGTTEQSET